MLCYLGHIGIYEDFDAGYRSKAEYDGWFKQDSLALQRRRLLENGWTEQSLSVEERRIDELLSSSVTKARAAALPNPDELFRGVFNEAH